MKECKVTDFFDLDAGTKRVVDEDGFLRVPGVIAKADNVQRYTAGELGLDGDPRRIVALYRPVEEVTKSASTFARKPITNNHPRGRWVTPDNWSGLGVGDTGDSVAMEGTNMVADLIFRDGKSIRDLQSGKVGLSNGYKFRFDDTRKSTPSGVAVDGWMTDIRGNHVALVERGRGGPECVVADKEKTMATRMEKIGSLSFELDITAADAVALERERTDRIAADAKTAEDLASAAEKRAVEAEAAVKTHLEKIKALDAEIEGLKKSPPPPSDDVVEKAAEVRTTVCADATVLAPDIAPKGKGLDAIRREALAAAVAKREDIKHVADSLLAGVALDKADAAKVEQAFVAAVAVARTTKAADTDLGAELLRAGSGERKEDKKSTATDGTDGLIGQALYAQRFCHRARPSAS